MTRITDALKEIRAGLYDYQREAVDAAIRWAEESDTYGLTVAATGAGKSHIIAGLATEMHIRTGRNVVCIQPRAELVQQNFAKLAKAFGLFVPATVCAASAGQKNTNGPIVYTMPETAKNLVRDLRGAGCVIIDEAHGVTPTIKAIVDDLKAANPALVVMGLTATPYRTGEGYIYAVDAKGESVPPESTSDPFFGRVTYEILAPKLIGMGRLTRPAIANTGDADQYEALGMKVNSAGKFNAADVRSVFVGKGRKTAKIVGDFVARSQALGLKKGIVFAASIEHGEEIMASMPSGSAVLVTGKMNARDRAAAIEGFSSGRYTWIVNVDILTTGFDEPAIDHAVFMRATESPGLFQQMIGRVLRLYAGKEEAFVFDYARNLERFFGDDPEPMSLFDPEVTKRKEAEEGEREVVRCVECHGENHVKIKPDWEEFPMDAHGYVVSLSQDGDPVRLADEWGRPIPRHYGRRCYVYHERGDKMVRCGGRWVWRDCPECGEQNDIAARKCETCAAEIVDPNKKLVVRSRYAPREAWRVTPTTQWYETPHTAKSGAQFDRVSFSGVPVEFWIPCEPNGQKQLRQALLYRQRPEGANAIAWRYSGDFGEFGGWFTSQTCPACEGLGQSMVPTQDKPARAFCERCRGSGYVAQRTE